MLNNQLLLNKWEKIPDFDDPRIKVLSDDDAIEVYNEIEREFERFAREETTDKMLALFPMFENDQNHVDLNYAFRSEIEKMPDYPPPSLFTSNSDNDFLMELRARCFMGGVIAYSDEIKTFHGIFVRMFAEATETKDVADFVTESDIATLTLHEIRLVLELSRFYGFGAWRKYFRLLSRLENQGVS